MVPVLPAALMPSRMARRPVPSSTTLFIIMFMSAATCGRDHLRRLLAVAVEAPDQVAGAGAHLEDGVRRRPPCRHWRRSRRRRCGRARSPRRRRSAATACRAAACAGPALRAMSRDLGAADLGVAVAERDRQLHRDGVDRARQRRGQRHRAGIAAGIVLRAPVADADRRVDHDRGRLEAAALPARSRRRRA